MQACFTLRRGKAMDQLSASESSYEQGKPSLWQLEQTGRLPLQRTLRNRQVEQVEEDFLGR